MNKNYALVFLGFNSMFKHKRGVENVIQFQSQASPFDVAYYLHWDTKTQVGKYEKLICIGVKKNLFWFITLNILLFKLKKRNNNIFIHSHNPLMSIMSYYKSSLLTVHDALFYLTGATKHKLNKVFWLLEKILYTRCGYVHFISDYAKRMSLYKKNKDFVIIPNTSHFETFKFNNCIVNTNLKKFSIGVTKVFIVRSIEERALINLIIEVAESLKLEKFEFIIAGKGPLLDFYRDEIKKIGLENITLLGYVADDDLIEFYQDCDVVLIPASYGEGFGLPIIEGYLFNKPVISSNVCAIPDVIISNDSLFENNRDSIVAKLIFAKEQNQNQFRDYYDEHFSNRVVISKMNELYIKLL
jgi:glycosyltransferase involved in cell wall biosynthesis